MPMPLIAAALLAQAAPAAAPDPVARMVALYDALCLKTFPDDVTLAEAMAARNATPLTVEQTRVTLHDDPGRGWFVRDGDLRAMVILELPPYHACSVRALVGEGPHDLSALTAATGAYEAAHTGFVPDAPFDGARGGIHIHVESKARPLPDGSTDTLMIVEQQVLDPKQLGPGETAAPLRFVHQIRSPGVAP